MFLGRAHRAGPTLARTRPLDQLHALHAHPSRAVLCVLCLQGRGCRGGGPYGCPCPAVTCPMLCSLLCMLSHAVPQRHAVFAGAGPQRTAFMPPPCCAMPSLQELAAEEDRIYAAAMERAQVASEEARSAFRERKRQELLQVGGG